MRVVAPEATHSMQVNLSVEAEISIVCFGERIGSCFLRHNESMNQSMDIFESRTIVLESADSKFGV